MENHEQEVPLLVPVIDLDEIQKEEAKAPIVMSQERCSDPKDPYIDESIGCPIVVDPSLALPVKINQGIDNTTPNSITPGENMHDDIAIGYPVEKDNYLPENEYQPQQQQVRNQAAHHHGQGNRAQITMRDVQCICECLKATCLCVLCVLDCISMFRR